MAGLTCKRCGASFRFRRAGSKRYCDACCVALGADQHHCADCKQDMPRTAFAPRITVCHACFGKRQRMRYVGKLSDGKCARCRERPANRGRLVCGVCLVELQQRDQGWCSIGDHAVARSVLVFRSPKPAACPECISKLQGERDDALINAGTCAVCNGALHTHARCTACGILIGAKHVSATIIDGECAACARWHARNGRRG
jgi:hypothetical protein